MNNDRAKTNQLIVELLKDYGFYSEEKPIDLSTNTLFKNHRTPGHLQIVDSMRRASRRREE